MIPPPLSNLSTSNPSLFTFNSLSRTSFTPNPNSNSPPTPFLSNSLPSSPKFQFAKPLHLISLCSSHSQIKPATFKISVAQSVEDPLIRQNEQGDQWREEIRNPVIPQFVSTWVSRFSLGDWVFLPLVLVACTISVAFTSFVVVAVPMLFAMRRTATSLAKLADTAREELPSTMTAIRLSSMEISDLTLELSDLSQEISEGVTKSAQAVQAAEAGVKQLGAIAQQQTASMIEERANLPVISLQPVMSGAAKKTSHAVGNATRTIMSFISGGEADPVSSDDDAGSVEEGDI